MLGARLQLQSKFELQLYYYIYFQTSTLWKGMNSLILPSYGLNSITTLFCKDGFGIKLFMNIDMGKVDIPLNKETKPNL